jgi:hypothetical protein
MLSSIVCILWASAFFSTLAIAAGARIPIWVPVFFSSAAGLLSCIPLR